MSNKILGLLAVVFLVSCAHVKTVAVACEPTGGNVATVAADFAAEGYEAALLDLAAKEGWCVVSAAVDQLLATKGAQLDPAVMAHARAWRAAHP